MLKGKKSLYILLPVNLFIWGYMGYKIYSVLNDDESSTTVEIMLPVQKLKISDSGEYVPLVNYKDPFLKEEQRIRNRPTVAQPASFAPRPPEPAKQPTPQKKSAEIRYLGLIENKTSGSTAAMVSVDGNSRIIKPGQVVDGMVFQSITSDFIVVKVGKEKLTIMR